MDEHGLAKMTETVEQDIDPTARLKDAALRHGVELTSEQAQLGAEWRAAMVSAVDAVRGMGVQGCEPAAVFNPVKVSRRRSGG